MTESILRRSAVEAAGTFGLVLGGCGAAVLAAGVEPGGIGWLGVALAFGFAVAMMAWAIGPISGGHFNPAVSVGLVLAGRLKSRDLPPYVVAQLAGAIAAAVVLYGIASGQPGFSTADGFATNGYGAASPGGYSLAACLLAEVVLTALFVLVILGATAKTAPVGFGPLAIGLALALVHLVDIPVTNASVNPARSTGPAVIAGGVALAQLWLFWVAPIAGAALGAVAWRLLGEGAIRKRVARLPTEQPV